MGTLLAVGRRTIAAALRVMGLGGERCFHKYHRLLSRVKWGGLTASRLLLVRAFFSQSAPLVFGLDETLERRGGKRIGAKASYRDPVRSSCGHVVKCFGLRWVCAMLLCPIPWAGRVWALLAIPPWPPVSGIAAAGPALQKASGLGPPAHWPAAPLAARTHPGGGGDSAYAALELLGAVRHRVTMITRLRLDAALYDPPPPRGTGQRGPRRRKGGRQPSLVQVVDHAATQWQSLVIPQWYAGRQVRMEVAAATAIWYHAGRGAVPIRWVLVRAPRGQKPPTALLSTDEALDAAAIINYFIRRWTIEVTLEEARAHLGVESQRQWSNLSIQRSTPCLLGLYSITTLWADQLQKTRSLEVGQTAWYHKKQPSFSDILAAVRKQIWHQRNYCTSEKTDDMIQIPKRLLDELTSILCRAA